MSFKIFCEFNEFIRYYGRRGQRYADDDDYYEGYSDDEADIQAITSGIEQSIILGQGAFCWENYCDLVYEVRCSQKVLNPCEHRKKSLAKAPKPL